LPEAEIALEEGTEILVFSGPVSMDETITVQVDHEEDPELFRVLSRGLTLSRADEPTRGRAEPPLDEDNL
jgi:hypothetical protein